MEDESSIEFLNEKFGIPGAATIGAGRRRLARVQIEALSGAGEIYLHGAQVTSWRPSGMSEVIFLSEKAIFQQGKAIRGGIPVCFPWFRGKADDPNAPAHGFVRTKEWELESISLVDEGAVCARFSTASDTETRQWWPFEFRLEYGITVGKRLDLELTMQNTGDTSLRFEEALHSYFRVGNVRNVPVRGLQGLEFLDNRDGNRVKTQEGDLVVSKQTDNAYRSATGAVEIVDKEMGRRITVVKHNSNSTIVWNPGSDGSAKMSDLGKDEWQRMLCVEGANIMNAAVNLEKGEAHRMRVSIDVLKDRG